MIKALNKFWDGRILGGLLIFFALVSFLGLSPRPHLVRQELQAAQRALEYGSPADAAKHLAKAAEYNPSRIDLWESAGRYAVQGGDPQAAIVYLERVGVDRLSRNGHIALGDAYRHAGDTAAALEAWKAADPSGEISTEIYQRMLEVHLSQGDYPAATSVLRMLTASRPNDASLHYRLGLLLTAQDPPSAVAYLVRAAELDPGLSETVRILRRRISAAEISDEPAHRLLSSGRALASLGEWEYAAEAFRQATLLRPDYAEAWAFLGEARYHTQNQREPNADGRQELEKALELDPESLAATLFMGLYHQRNEAYAQALDYFLRAVELDPVNPTLYVELGSAYVLLGELENALEAYRKAVELAPEDTGYLRHLADFSMKSDYEIREIALPAARRAVIAAPRDPDNLNVMAQVLIQLNDLLNAERFLQRALQIDPQYLPARLHLGVVYALQGQTQRAYQEFDFVRRSAGENAAAAKQADRLLQIYFP